MNSQRERVLLITDPWVQLMWHGSQRPCLFGYLKMTSSPPIRPSGQEETQCGPSCRLAHATHSSAPFKGERRRDRLADRPKQSRQKFAKIANLWQCVV